MSVAFRRESDEEHLEPKFERPIPPGANLVTPRGLSLIVELIAGLEAELHGTADEALRSVLQRDLRYWMARRATAVLAPPPSGDTVQFGSRVTIRRKGREQSFRIVGVDQADPAQGLISVHSPLAQAVIGARIGDLVEAREPLGEIEVIALS